MTDKVTIINQVAGPMCIDIANSFEKKGWDTTLITGVMEPTYAILDEKVKLIKGITYQRNQAAFRILTWFGFFFQSLFRLLWSEKSRKLLLVSNPPLAPFLGLIMNKVFGQKYDLLIYDIYPDVLYEMGYISKSSLIYKILIWLNIKTFVRANRVITLSEGMKEILSKYVSTDKIEIIPCWVDNSKIKPIIPKSKNQFAVKYKQENKTTILYSGNMGTAHNVEIIIEAAKELQNNSRIHFLLIGNGVKFDKVNKLISDYRLNNVTLLPFQEADIVPYSMACGDISIVTTEEKAGSFMIPSRTFYYMAAGSKILAICKPQSELDILMQSKNIGKSVLHNVSSLELASIIRELSKDISKERKMEISGFSNHFNKDHANKF
ncbi:MAG: glycosyltransferase family 4 protein [Saprospiraceae bacterium]